MRKLSRRAALTMGGAGLASAVVGGASPGSERMREVRSMMGNGWGMGWMWIIWPLVVIGIVLAVVLLVRGRGDAANRGGGSAPPPGSGNGRTRAQEILDERYARGELTDEEYQERLRQLRGEKDR
jgi:putative membrane protein